MPIAYPYRFSDWYGYDKDCASVTGFLAGSGQSGSSGICNQLSSQTTYYHNGSGTYPVVGDTMFTNSAGAAVADPKHYHYDDGGTDKKIHITGTDGYVAGISNCAP